MQTYQQPLNSKRDSFSIPSPKNSSPPYRHRKANLANWVYDYVFLYTL